MDESAAQQRARSLIAVVNPITIPVSVADYVRHVEGVLRIEDDMEANEPGMSFISKGKLHVCVNRRDCPERQRFTICHEVAHHVLGIPSDHNAVPWWSYAKRSPNEILCDVFAAELLLPWKLFKPHADAATPGFPVLDQLAAQFEASVTCTGSRFATVVGIPCAFILAEQGCVRYASRSTPLRSAGVWIQPRSQIPETSLSARMRHTGQSGGPEGVDPDLWFSDWTSGGTLNEEARHLTKWDQTLTLLWGEEEEIRMPGRPQMANAGDDEYRELDGVLPWPGKSKRKR